MPGITPEQCAELAAPFAPEAVHWRAQTVTERGGKHSALALAYLDARDVQDRLDGVCGPENWQDAYQETPKGRIICALSIRIGDDWITKSDGAGDTDVEGEKGALSDAMKRAAVKWGIGRYLYSMPSVWVPCELNQHGKFKKFTDDPWKHVRGYTAPKAPERPAYDLNGVIDQIEACETLMALKRWWKDHGEQIPDGHYDAVLKTFNKRTEAIKLMDRSAA